MAMPEDHEGLLWWLIPGRLAGMPMPYVSLERRMNRGGTLDEHSDDLPRLRACGIRAVVSHLDLKVDARVFRSAGFEYHLSPVPDGGVPAMEQMQEVLAFMDQQMEAGGGVAVHCLAGQGRTGTTLAAYLISKGVTGSEAIRKVRAANPAAIETGTQVRFLEQFARVMKGRRT